MGRVAGLIRAKGHDVYTIESGASVYDAVKRMVDHKAGSLLVVDGGEIRGIITERDYLREIVLKGRTSKTTQVRTIMTADPVCVGPNDSIEECMALMTSKRIRHLPVLEENKILGVISIGDVVKAIISEQEFTIKQLENYISGGR